MQTLEQLQDKIKKAQFASLTYEAKGSGEIARHTVQLHVNYLNMLEKSLLECRLLDVDDIENAGNLPMRAAKAKVLKSLRKSIFHHKRKQQNPDYTKKHIYKHTGKGTTKHRFDESIEVHALVLKKLVIQKGEYKKTVSSPLVTAKKLIEKKLSKSKWRTFAFENVEKAKIAGFKFYDISPS